MKERTLIRKVKNLHWIAKEMAATEGFEPDDLVMVTTSIEKVVGDPVSYMLSKIHGSAPTMIEEESK